MAHYISDVILSREYRLWCEAVQTVFVYADATAHNYTARHSHIHQKLATRCARRYRTLENLFNSERSPA